VTVPVEEVPPLTLDGLRLSVLSAGALTVNRAVLVTVPYDAVMVDVVDAVTAFVVIVNLAVVAPARTVTLPGTVAAAVLLLVRVTTMPLVGATPLSVTVPVEPVPPITVAGLSESVDSAGGFTVKVVVRLTVPAEAVITTAV
jgi:hypothetical protein